MNDKAVKDHCDIYAADAAPVCGVPVVSNHFEYFLFSFELEWDYENGKFYRLFKLQRGFDRWVVLECNPKQSVVCSNRNSFTGDNLVFPCISGRI